MDKGETEIQIESSDGGLTGIDGATAKGTNKAVTGCERSEGSRLAPTNIFGTGKLRYFKVLHADYIDWCKWTQDKYDL